MGDDDNQLNSLLYVMMIQYVFALTISGNHKKFNELKLRLNVSVLELHFFFCIVPLIQSDRGCDKKSKQHFSENVVEFQIKTFSSRHKEINV